MSELVLVAGVVLATSISFFFSGVETGIYALNRVRLRLRTEERDPAASRLSALLLRPQLLISTILIGNHLANFAASWCSQGLVSESLGLENPELANTLLLTPVLFVLAEITPKNVYRLRAETLVYRSSRPLGLAAVLFRPLALLLRQFGRLTGALPPSGQAPDGMLARDRLQTLVAEVVEDGLLTPEQSRMVRNVMRLGSLPVEDAMVPMEKVDTVVEGFGRTELLSVSRRRRRTRIPVVSRDTGEPVGVVNALDLVYREGEDIGSLVSSPTLIAASDSVDRALRTLRAEKQTMALVTDHSGRTVGIVTVKDLVEEVSGDLPVF